MTSQSPTSSERSFIGSWAGFKTPSRRFLFRWAIADLVANIGLVVTGGAVRVTDSGLGCPTWPQCTSGSFVPHEAMGIHGIIEFGNRMLTWVLVAIAIATWVAAMRYVPKDRVARLLATLIALGVPLQGVIGGITVLTKLNPWVVSLHFLATMVIISLGTWLVFHTNPARTADAAPAAPTVVSRIGLGAAWMIYAITWVTIYLGTVVTGSGPHSGDNGAARNELDPSQATQLHVDAVWVLVGLASALVMLTLVAKLPARRAAVTFVGVIVVQGVIGYIQYSLDLPAWMVVLHMFGSALLMAGATYLVLGANRDVELGSAREAS